MEKQIEKLCSPGVAEPALDYILKDPATRVYFKKSTRNGKETSTIHDWQRENKANELTFKLKNAVMFLWLQVKDERKKKSFDQVIREYLKKQEEDKKQIKRKDKSDTNAKKASSSGDQ